MWESSKDVSTREMAVAARDCSRHLQVYIFVKSYVILVPLLCPVELHTISSFSSLFLLTRDTSLIPYVRLKQNLSSEERKKILLDVADALEANEDLIRSENEADVAAAQVAGYEKPLVARLTIKPGKVDPSFSLPN